MISVIMLMPIIPHLKARGSDIQGITAKAGLTPGKLGDPLATVPWDSAAQLFEVAAATCHDELFGFRCGLDGSGGRHSLLDYYARAMPSLGDALDAKASNARIIKTGHEVSFVRSMHGGRWEWRFLSRARRLQFGDYLLALHIRQVQGFVNSAPSLVEFDHSPLGSRAEYSSLLRARYRFDCTKQAVEWRRQTLVLPLPTADEHLVAALKPIIEGLAKENQGRVNFVARVKSVVCDQITEGHLGSDMVAKALGMSTRSMQRKLADEDATFRGVVEVAKKETASRLVQSTSMQFSEISNCLGYSELSSFSRQYKAWFGKSPRASRGRKVMSLGMPASPLKKCDLKSF